MSFSQALSAMVTGDSSALISIPSAPSRIFNARMPASRAIWAPIVSSFSYAMNFAFVQTTQTKEAGDAPALFANTRLHKAPPR